MKQKEITCPKCDGNGYLWKNPKGLPGYKCPECDTKGYIKSIVYDEYQDKKDKKEK